MTLPRSKPVLSSLSSVAVSRGVGQLSKMNRQLLIYLDQNKWIDLARAFHDRPDGNRFKSVLQKIKLAGEEGKAILPLSGTHVIETRASKDMSKRLRLSQVMSSISRGWTIAPSYVITPVELGMSVAKTFDQPLPAQPITFGRGIPFACGITMKLHKVDGPDGSTHGQVPQLIDESLSEAKVIEDFLCGGNEAVNLRALEKYRSGKDEIVKHQESFRAAAKSYGRAVLRRAYVAQLTLAIQPKLTRILNRFGMGMEDFLRMGEDRLMVFFSNVPTLDVETELAVARNEDWNRGIDSNDSADIAFLSVAIPYCDIVVTENYWRHQAEKTKLDKKYETIVLDDLLELEELLK